jgi:hypothetical protein
MIWLTWRQFRAAAAMMTAALAVLAAVLGLTGPGLADDYSTGIADCTTQSGGCSDFVQRFFQDHQDPPAGAYDYPRIGPLLFATRGIVPIGYAAFAFALGVTVGMLVHRTLPAMAITLAVFAAVQIAMPLLVRPHLIPPTRSNVEITTSNLEGFGAPRNGLMQARAVAADTDAWLLSSHTVDASGHAVDTIPLSASSGPCSTSKLEPPFACLAEIKRLGYRQQMTYQPASRFWPFQWYETGIYTALALGLAGFCFWRIRRRLS